MSKPLMDEKEIIEGRRAGIPELIIGKMVYGRGLTETEKGIVNQHEKAYVEPHKRDGVWVKPQLRNLSKGRVYMVDIITTSKVPEGWVIVTWYDSSNKKWVSKIPRDSYIDFKRRLDRTSGHIKQVEKSFHN